MFDNSKITDVTPIKPGLRKEGCKLTTFKKKPDEKGQISVIFTFVDSTGAQLAHREFMPKRISNTEKPMTDEDFKKNINLNVSRIAHISRAFLTEAEFLTIKLPAELAPKQDSLLQADVEANWNMYIRLTAQALQVNMTDFTVGKAAGVVCALKIVLSKSKDKYYSAFPKVPPFISTLNHPKEFTTNPQYDIYEHPGLIPDQETPAGGASIQDAAFKTAPTPNTANTTHESGF